MRHAKIILFTFLVLFMSKTTQAQELGLHFMPNVWQANSTNPAFMPEQRFVYSFPTLAFNVHHTGAAYNDLIRKDTEGNNVLDLDPVIGKLDPKNIIMGGLDVETFHFTFGMKNWRASVSHAIRSRNIAVYPKSLVQLGWQGNEPFIGDVMSVAPEFQLMSYSELGLGFAMKLPKVTVGGRVKILSGLYDFSSGQAEATVATSNEVYQLTLATNYQINASSVAAYGDLDDFEPEFGFQVLGGNMGLGLDLGATMNVNEKLTVSASLIDLGAIKWSQNTSNYTSEGTYTYEGLDLSDIIRDDEVDIDQKLDTLEQIFDFQETNNSYTTALPAKFYLSGQYKVNPFFEVGGLLFMQRFKQRNLMGLAVNATAKIGEIVSAGLTYSIYNKTYDNLGLSAAVKVGPVQLFGVSDNLIALVNPYNSRNTNFRFGLNLAFK